MGDLTKNIRAAVEQAKKDGTLPLLRQQLQAADTDGDRQISYKEFSAASRQSDDPYTRKLLQGLSNTMKTQTMASYNDYSDGMINWYIDTYSKGEVASANKHLSANGLPTLDSEFMKDCLKAHPRPAGGGGGKAR